MAHWILLVSLSAFALSACFSPSKTVVADQAAHVGPPTIRKMRADGELLRISIAQDSAPAWVGGVQAQVIDGDVYLSTIHISSVVHATEFAVDLSGPKFPRDWRKRLYWIEGESIDSPFNPFIEHKREIRRSRIVLEE